MANQEHFDVLKQGAETWNQWRREHMPVELLSVEPQALHVERWNQWRRKHLGTRPDLNGVDLKGADLDYVELYFTNLVGACFSKATLRRARFDGADLSFADLSEANLLKATFGYTNLSGANLSGADLSGADIGFTNLSAADLRGANLSGANLSGADLRGANLSRAILVQTNLSGATLTNCRVYGISAWDVELAEADQSNLIITYSSPDVIADNLEVAQFIYLLLNHKKLRDVFNSVTERGVLLLGRFSGGGLEVLQAIAAWSFSLCYRGTERALGSTRALCYHPSFQNPLRPHHRSK
jgi:uncharacterized protein YjbI with pentapeptide repeats